MDIRRPAVSRRSVVSRAARRLERFAQRISPRRRRTGCEIVDCMEVGSAPDSNGLGYNSSSFGGRQLSVSTLITDKSRSAAWQTIGTLAFVWWNTSLSPPVARRRAGRAELDFVVSQIRTIRHQTEFAVLGLGEVCTDDLNVIVQGLDDPRIAVHDATSRNGRLKFDTAVIYDRGKVALEGHRSVVDRRGRQSLKTGEVVEFTVTATGDTFHLVVSHWPSRLSVAQSAPERAELGIALRWAVENIRTDASPYIVLMGDYNDDPFSPSLSEHLLATRDRYLVRAHGDLLYNPFWKRLGESHDHSDDDPPDGVCGTYFYHKGRASRWFTFDQMIFSSEFLQRKALVLDETNSGILVPLDLRAKLLNPKEIFDHLPVLGVVELRSKT